MENFDPSSFAVKNGNFIGLPFDEAQAQIILLPVPWEATVSYAAGTATAAENIREAAYQLDLEDLDLPDAWKKGIYLCPSNPDIKALSDHARTLAIQHIDSLELQQPIDNSLLDEVNQCSAKVNEWVYQKTKNYLQKGKLIGLVGGEHSIPYGYIKALAEAHGTFGILQLDAHCDLRVAYEDFKYSHASIYYNVLESIREVAQLTQVAIRDFCTEELDYAKAQPNRISIFTMQAIREEQYTQNRSYHALCEAIVATLPQKVYISFDIDGLDPKLCPNTGTPVPGGLELQEAFYLLKVLVKSGRTIIGFDLSEVGSAAEWDGNVGARILYKLSNLMAKSQDLPSLC